MEVKFKHFRSSMSSWEELFNQAAEFATQIGPQNLINISHSEDQNDGVVTVWYWQPNAATPLYPATPHAWRDR